MDIIILLMWAAIDEECSIRDAANYILFTGAVDSWPSSNPTDQELVLSILQEGHVFENLPHVIGNFEEFSRQPILEDDDRSPHWEAVLLAAARYPILLQEHFEYEIVEGSSASLLG
ncbi:hypothetical protein H6775_02460 [Candidatus Nomurabacteria bacterium]|nr:hypothetical protein [Candidatus Nomurabacteria bacterium]